MDINMTKAKTRCVAGTMVMLVVVVFCFAAKADEWFDLLNYRYLWNDAAEKARMVINPASKKKIADDWKPTRKLTADECTKLIEILTNRFGQPARCRNGYASFVYVWRFEGDEWLSVGVCTKANNGGDAIAIYHWEWRRPELSVYDEEEVKARKYPIVQIEKEELPPAAFFEFFNPYASIKDGETEKNFVTEFNATKYLEESDYTRCTAEWDDVERRYEIYTPNPDKWRFEYDACKGGPNGGHTNEYLVGIVRFYKLASDLFMCYSMFSRDGTMGPDRVRYLFEVYDRDIWSVDSDKPIKSKMVRYIGAVPIDAVPKFREEWLLKQERLQSAVSLSDNSTPLPGSLYKTSPNNAELLSGSDDIALFAGETEEDAAVNGGCQGRNSLFLRLRQKNGAYTWRLLLTTGTSWCDAEYMSKWGKFYVSDVKKCFKVRRASISRDGRTVWLVCDVDHPMFSVVCSYDMQTNTFRVLIDGNDVAEEPDGTIRVCDKKSYPDPDDGRGAIWRDVWITSDGKIVREGKITLRGCEL